MYMGKKEMYICVWKCTYTLVGSNHEAASQGAMLPPGLFSIVAVVMCVVFAITA
jgi:hypothetical protein